MSRAPGFRSIGLRAAPGVRRTLSLATLFALVFTFTGVSHAGGRAMLGIGDGLRGTEVQTLQGGYSRGFGSPWQPASWLTVHPLWEASISHVAPDGQLSRFADTWTVAAQVGGRVPLALRGRLFAEAATGPVYISERQLDTGSDKLDWGSDILFRSHVGIGWFIDSSRRVFATYRLQHTSNAGIDDTNPGIDFQVVSVGIAFP